MINFDAMMPKEDNRFDKVMVDIETLDNISSAKLLQVGMVAFRFVKDGEAVSVEKGGEWSCLVKYNDWEQHYATEGADTLEWWEKQDQEVRAEVFSLYDRVDIKKAFLGIREFWEENITENGKLFCHSSFDAPILSFHAKNNGVVLPYSHYQVMDLRTLETVARKTNNSVKLRPERDESKSHDALYDCHYQIEYLKNINNVLGGIL